MRICVVGAGAIGGMVGAKLAVSGHHVTLIQRGANLEAVKAKGLTLIEENGNELVAHPTLTTAVIAEAGVQDVIILAVKAHQVEAVAPDLPAIMRPGTRVITMQNGIPWWYFHKLPGNTAAAFAGSSVPSVDPDGMIAKYVPIDSVIASVVYPACEVTSPGVIKVIEGNKFSLGELDGVETTSIKGIAGAFRAAGFKTPISRDIRSEIWLKLWGNLSFNPISALTHSTLEDLCVYPATRALVAAMMTEAQAIGQKLGVEFKVSIDQRIAGGQAVGQHKTSMLQDVEMGRPIELEALVGSVLDLARITETPAPSIRAIYAVASLLGHNLQHRKATLSIL